MNYWYAWKYLTGEFCLSWVEVVYYAKQLRIIQWNWSYVLCSAVMYYSIKLENWMCQLHNSGVKCYFDDHCTPQWWDRGSLCNLLTDNLLQIVTSYLIQYSILFSLHISEQQRSQVPGLLQIVHCSKNTVFWNEFGDSCFRRETYRMVSHKYWSWKELKNVLWMESWTIHNTLWWWLIL